MQVITNSKGSGDWVVVKDHSGNVLFSDYKITPQGLVDLLQAMGCGIEPLVEITDSEMEQI
jgi:hypothetical protein